MSCCSLLMLHPGKSMRYVREWIGRQTSIARDLSLCHEPCSARETENRDECFGIQQRPSGHLRVIRLKSESVLPWWKIKKWQIINESGLLLAASITLNDLHDHVRTMFLDCILNLTEVVKIVIGAYMRFTRAFVDLWWYMHVDLKSLSLSC